MTGRSHGRGRVSRAVRPGLDHARGDGSGAGRVGPVPEETRIARLPIDVGGVRPTLAQLRAAAELERDSLPSASRYQIWAIAIASGQPISEVERIRYIDAPYLMKMLTTRKVPDGVS